jgi:hypothetical protein
MNSPKLKAITPTYDANITKELFDENVSIAKKALQL